MICLPRKTKSVIIYLLVGCLFQMGTIHATPLPQSDTVTPSDTNSNPTDQTDSISDNVEKPPINGVENVGDVFKSLIKNTGLTVSDLRDETGQSLKDIAHAGGRATLALGYLCNQLFNGISATVATGSGYLASGVRNIDDVVGDLPVVGLVTGTLDSVSTQLANTIGEISTNGRKSRQKMFESLREKLNRSSGRLPTTNNTGSTASTNSGNEIAQ
ncbi:uncharacterized protein LOC112591362 [Melanaphis sacchari]|uniref:uncharacterized protein LOC112591362 n=1 Tax=Melanaphis sacchari TaxID=742174 RepID=UPI000DC14E99|nr:uncharacterized protein LOC112591362 [Melanaphis sacchari]XP_025190945.1 uncharacterized protein LOC112591362 [Melanaphis sacchari]